MVACSFHTSYSSTTTVQPVYDNNEFMNGIALKRRGSHESKAAESIEMVAGNTFPAPWSSAPGAGDGRGGRAGVREPRGAPRRYI